MHDLYSLSEQLGRVLREKGLYLVTAESCTGGLLGHLITEVPGSSDYYLGGFVAYSNEAKMRFLRVSSETLDKFGAVSEQTVREMASGARRAFSGIQPEEKIIAVAISGVAGPGGGTPEKPVGTVWIGVETREKNIEWKNLFKGNRTEIKIETALDVLQRIVSLLLQ
jgi:nicotinamide-nucleotide amidase